MSSIGGRKRFDNKVLVGVIVILSVKIVCFIIVRSIFDSRIYV